MTEVDALLEIAKAIRMLAGAVAGIGTVLWLAFFLKSMSANSSINRLADVAEQWLRREKDKMR